MRDTRNPLFVFTASLLSLGLYTVYWHFQMRHEIRSFGGEVPSPWIQFVPVVNLWFFYRFIDAAVQSLPRMQHSWLHVVFHVVFPWFSAGLVQHRVNEYYEQAVPVSDGSVSLEDIVDIVDKALVHGHDQEYVEQRLRDKGVPTHYINEAFRIENKRNGYL